MTPVLRTCHRVLDVKTPPDAVYTVIYFVAGVKSVCVINLIATILGFMGGCKTEMIQ